MIIANGASTDLSWRVRSAEWVGRYLLPPFTLATAITGAFLTYDWPAASRLHPGLSTIIAFLQAWMGPVFLIVAIATAILAAVQSCLRPSLSALQQKIDLVGQSFRTLCDGLMGDLSSKLAVGQGDQTRSSLYVHDGDEKFVLCGRYAPDPVLKRPGRPSYPDDQGCIGVGWRNGWHFENALGNGYQYTNNTLARYKISAQELAKIPMKSELFGVQRIDVGQEFIGLIVVESLRADRFDENSLKAELIQFANDYGAIIKSFRQYVPTPSAAKARGF